MYHYAYIITNITDSKKYIGIRTSKVIPSKDLGIKYFSSSKDMDFIKDQKVNPQNYMYEILKQCKTRKEALTLEVKLHKKYDVASSPKFYNIVNQTSSKFDTTGFIFVNNIKISVDDYRKQNKLKYHSYKKHTVVDKDGNSMQVSTNDERYINGELVSIQTGKVMAKNKNGKIIKITKEEYDIGNYVGTNKGKLPVRDKNGNCFLVNKNDRRIKTGELVHTLSGIIIAKNIKTGEILGVSKEEFSRNKNYVGCNYGKINGSANPNAKTINIYNNKNELVYKCQGNFKKVCLDNNLPIDALRASYGNGGTPMYISEYQKKNAKKENLAFIGWYAIKEN